MDNEKYYTPEISEYHHGFEYEYSYKNGIWRKEIFSIGLGDMDEMAGDWYEDSPNSPYTICRVKYLDEEDIEKCGFTEKQTRNSENWKDFTFDNGRYFVHINWLKLSTHSVVKIETSVEENSVRTLVIHSIRIKNISELRTLMQMLNIK